MTLTFDLPPCPETWLSRLDARWKLAALTLAAATCAFLQTLPAALLALGGAAALAAASRLPWRWLASRLGLALALLALLIVWRPLLPQPGDETTELAGLTLSL